MVEDNTETENLVVSRPVKADKPFRLSKLEIDIPTETANEVNNHTERDEARDVTPDIVPLPLVRRGDILRFRISPKGLFLPKKLQANLCSNVYFELLMFLTFLHLFEED